MAINFKPFEELFAPEYQLTYISMGGHIDVGPNTYSVFYAYTMSERQVIFQVCEKHLPWEYTQEQEQWERTQYMYQFIIKSPPPFPYEEYQLNEDIMAFTIDEERITRLVIDELRTRKKLDAARATRDAELRTGVQTVTEQVDEKHASVLLVLQTDFDAAEEAIKKEFE